MDVNPPKHSNGSVDCGVPGFDDEECNRNETELTKNSLYENNAERGSFSDLLEMISEAKPDGTADCSVNSTKSSQAESKSTSKSSARSNGTWKDFVRTKKWKGQRIHFWKEKKKEKHKRDKRESKKQRYLRHGDESDRNKNLHPYKKRDQDNRDINDGEYFHIFLLEYFWKICKFDTKRFRQIVMRLFNSGIFDVSFHRLQRLVADRAAVSVGLHELMASLLEEFKCLGVSHPAYYNAAPLLLLPSMNGSGRQPPRMVYGTGQHPFPKMHKRCFSSAALDMRRSSVPSTGFRAPSPPLLRGASPMVAFASRPASPEWTKDTPIFFQPISRYYEEFIEIPGTLGRGGFGSVYRAQRHFDGVIYAIKKIHFRISLRSTRALETVVREVRALACLDHPNVCRYYNAWIEQIQESDLLLYCQQHGDSVSGDGEEEEEEPSTGLSIDATTNVPSELLRSTSEEEDERGLPTRLSSPRTKAKIWSLDGSMGKEDLDSSTPSSRNAKKLQPKILGDGEDGWWASDPCNNSSMDSGKSCGDENETDIAIGHYVNGCNLSTIAEEEESCTKMSEDKLTEDSVDGDDGGLSWASTYSFGGVDGGENVKCTVPEEKSGEKSTGGSGKYLRTEMEDREAEKQETNSRSEERNVYRGMKGEMVVFQKPRATHTLFIQMQCYEEDTLKNFLAQEGRKVDRRENLRIFRQIVEALQHIHGKGIYHRDLKPANIFLHQKIVKLGDFGLAKEIQHVKENSEENEKDQPCAPECVDSHLHKEERHTGGLGTMSYAAPEQKLAHGKYTEKVDIYPLGIILFEMFCPSTTQMERMLNMSNLQKGTLPSEMLKHYPEESAMILRMVSTSPSDRPSAAEILESGLFQKDRNELVVDNLRAEGKEKDAIIAKQAKKLKRQSKRLKRQEKIIQELSAQLKSLKGHSQDHDGSQDNGG